MLTASIAAFKEEFEDSQKWKDQCFAARSQLSELSVTFTAKEEELAQVNSELQKIREELNELKKKTTSSKFHQLMEAVKAFSKEEQ